jgi:hypothetical protein
VRGVRVGARGAPAAPDALTAAIADLRSAMPPTPEEPNASEG